MVGSVDGSTDGSSVGSVVGSLVGNTVGEVEGTTVDGDKEGLTVEDSDGCCVVIVDGRRVGLLVRNNVGVLDGL